MASGSIPGTSASIEAASIPGTSCGRTGAETVPWCRTASAASAEIFMVWSTLPGGMGSTD